MDTAGWVQVLSIAVLCITIFTTLWKVARWYSKIEGIAKKANERIDAIEKREGDCPMGNTIKAQVEENKREIHAIKEENKNTAVEISAIKTDIGNIKLSINEVKGDVKEILLAVKK